MHQVLNSALLTDDEIISQEELLEDVATAELEYMKGNSIQVNSMKELLD